VLLLVTAYLGVAWTLVLLVDFLNLAGVQTWMVEKKGPMPLLWHHIFLEGLWTARAQWLLSGGCALCAFSMWRWTRREKATELRSAMFLLTAGACLLLVPAYFDTDIMPVTAGTFWTVSAGLFVASLIFGPVMVLFLYRRFSRRVYLLTFGACGLYAIAGIGLILKSLGQWQENLGQWIILRFDLAALPAWAHTLENGTHLNASIESGTAAMGRLLTDHLVTGSLELMAAGMLLAAFLAIRTELLNTDNGNVSRRDDREAQVLFNVIRRGLDNTHRRHTALGMR
jgi:hypothetical protein